MNQTRQLDSRPAADALPSEPEVRGSIRSCSPGLRSFPTGIFGGLFLGSLLGLSACPGNLEDPQRFETAPTATATATTPTGGAGASGAPTVVVDPCVTTLFTASCAFVGCHAGGAAAGDLDLSTTGLASRLVGVDAKFTGVVDPTTCMPAKYIDTTTPANSWLLVKLAGAQGSCGSAMPIGAPLTADQTNCVKAFVNSAAGAK